MVSLGFHQAIIELLVQLFYCWRIKVLTRQRWAAFLIMFLAVTGCGAYSHLEVRLIHRSIGLSMLVSAISSTCLGIGPGTSHTRQQIEVSIPVWYAIVDYLVHLFTSFE